MKKPKQVRQGDSLSYYIQTENKFGQQINIPVIDVRDGPGERALGEQIIRAQNRSKFLVYNMYHESPRKTNQ